MGNVEKYLSRYAEKEIHLPVSGSYHSLVVLPLCGETIDDLLDSLKAASAHLRQKVLAIGVINESAATDPAYRPFNQELLRRFFKLTPLSTFLDFLPVDRVNDPFPADQGVGLARKIGCDIAVKLWTTKQLESHWIHTTDGDATVSEDYFSDDESPLIRGLNLSIVGAEIFPYEHVGEGTLMDAHRTYEAWMDSYVNGLERAGSPYAFPTIGSTLKIDISTYADVRGFPRKNAAEDFYLLNKIAKVASVRLRKTGKVTLRARHSHRVPFGTGVSVGKIINNEKRYAPYPREVFESLALSYHWAERVLGNANAESFSDVTRNHFAENHFFSTIEEARTRKSIDNKRLHFHRNFDALKILKTMRSLTEALA